jgi:hypothetical protein
MKKTAVTFLFLVCCFTFILFSCPGSSYTEEEYNKCFFLGEKSFIFEGELIFRPPPPVGYPEPEHFVSVAAKLDANSLYIYDNSDLYEGWEITGTKISENKFQLSIDTTANGITIEKETIVPDCYYEPVGFPDDFPAIGLKICFNGYDGENIQYYREPDVYRKNEYNYYICYYVYVAEPIDLSETRTGEEVDTFGRHFFYTRHYDLNFSKPGWYKILNHYNSKIGNDPKFSSSTNNYFFW